MKRIYQWLLAVAIVGVAIGFLTEFSCGARASGNLRCCCQTMTGGWCCRIQPTCLALIPGCQCRIN